MKNNSSHFDQSIQGDSEWIYMQNNNSNIDMEKSLAGVTEKIYFANASIINKNMVQKEKEEFHKIMK
jgi:hypothetical protein